MDGSLEVGLTSADEVTLGRVEVKVESQNDGVVRAIEFLCDR